MTMERVGVQAIVEGAGQYLNDAQRVNAATFGMGQAAKSAEGSFNVFAAAQEASRQRLRQTGALMRETGTQALFLGAALAAPGALAVKFAADFESAFAGVRKTVDATEAEFGVLRTGILNLTSELPTSAAGLADIAAAAGQLGVAKSDILDFTRVTAQLAATTDLSTEAAATGLARFANVLQLPQDAVERTAAALVDLGNKSAATESEILDISQRIAAAGKTIGLTADQVLAFGTALRSVGVESEAGGTAFSRVFIEIAKAVEGGGTNLQRFAEVAGVSGQQFADAFRRDAASAVVDFVEGLGRIQATGEGTFGVLEELSLNDARLTRALLSAASAGDLFRESLATGANAFQQNTALTAEFAKRIETTQAQFRLFINELQRFGIETGAALLPAARAIIGALRGIVGAMNELPGPVKTTIALVSLLGGGLVIAVGTLGIFAGSVLSIVGVLGVTGLGGALAGATAALGTFTAASLAFIVTPVGAALTAIVVAVAAATIAYRKLTAESEAVTRANKAQEESAKRLSGAVRDAAKAAEEREAVSAGKKPGTGDAQRVRGTEALTKAQDELAAAIGRVAEAEARAAAEAARRFGAQPGAPTAPSAPRSGAALLVEAGALQQPGRGFRRADVTGGAAQANFDFAAAILGGAAPLERVDPLVLQLTASLSENEKALLAAAAAARLNAREIDSEGEALNVERGRFAESAKAAITVEESRRRMVTASQAFQEAQRALDSVLASGAATAQDVADAEARVAEALRETDAAAAEAVVQVGAITNAQEALAFSASEAGKKQRELNQALFQTAVANAAAANRPRAFEGGDAEAEAAGFGFAADFGRLTGQAALDALQQGSRDEAQRIADRVAAATKAGRGAASLLDRRREAIESTTKRQREEQAAALIRERVGLKPGEQGLSEVQAEQRRLDVAFSGVVDELRALGFEVPEEFRDMFDRINSTAEDGAKRSGTKIGGLLGFLIARRLGRGLDPTAGLVSQPPAVSAALRGQSAAGGVNIEQVTIGPGTSTGDIQQGMGVAFRGAFGSQ